MPVPFDLQAAFRLHRVRLDRVGVTSLGSDSGFGIQRFELDDATSLNRRRQKRSNE